MRVSGVTGDPRGLVWLAVPALLTSLAFVFPPAAAIPVVALVAMYVLTRARSEVRGHGVGMALGVLAVAGSNSAPTEFRVGAVVLAILLTIWVAFLGEGRRGMRFAAAGGLLALLLYGVLITTALGSASLLTVTVAFGAVIAVALVTRSFGPRDFVAMSRWIVGVVAVQAILAVAEITVLSAPIWGFRNTTSAGLPVLRYNPFLGDAVLRTQGSFGHPIPFALFMIVALFVCLAPIMKVHRFLRWTGIVLSLTGLFLSGTRSAFIAAGVAMLYYLIASRGIKAKTRNIVIIAVVASILVFGDFGIRTVVFDLLQSDSLAHRVDGWDLATGLLGRGAVTVIFGSGLYSEMAAFQAGYLQQDGFFVIDNQWLTQFVTTGLIGALLLLAVLVVGWWRAGRSGRALILAITVMFFSFDVTTWPASSVLLALAIALPREATVLPSPVASGDLRAPVGSNARSREP